MKALVTGSTGFIGGALCRSLIQQGWDVRAFHRATSRLKLLEDLPVEHAIGDLTNHESIKTAAQGMQVIFHAGALLGSREQLGRMYTVTVEGTRAVMQAALEARVERVVHTSSVAALGIPDHTPGKNMPPALMDEHHTWNYRPELWPYGYAKYLAELEAQQAVAMGLDVVIVNPSFVFGRGDIYRQNSSLVMQVARKRVPVLVDGGLNVVHIDDVVAGHLAALQYGRSGERYILGGENLTHLRLVQIIADAAGVPAPDLVLPGGLVRFLSTPLRWLEPLLDLPVSPQQLRQAGLYFYYNIQKAQMELKLPNPQPVEKAVASALDWFRLCGPLTN
jgi:dihydroflavonol-4-reductase